MSAEEDNIQGWFCAEDDGNQMRKQNHPLLLKQMAVVMSKLQEFKVKPRSLSYCITLSKSVLINVYVCLCALGGMCSSQP